MTFTSTELLFTVAVLCIIIWSLVREAHATGRVKGRAEGLAEAKRLTWAALRQTVNDSTSEDARSAAWRVARLFTEDVNNHLN